MDIPSGPVPAAGDRDAADGHDGADGPAAALRAWIRWFGPTRVALAALSVLTVAAGGYWLLRTPPPPVEGSLPMSSTVPATSVADAEAATVVTSGESTPQVITVHVAGAVQRPGVYELPADARVEAALASAGGALADADSDALNLAAPVSDGSRLFVPAEGQEVPPTVALVTPGGAGAGLGDAPGVPVDINRADRGALDELPGIGPATADAIVTERELHGPFVSVDELERVPGIGPAKVARLRDLVVV